MEANTQTQNELSEIQRRIEMDDDFEFDEFEDEFGYRISDLDFSDML